MVVGGEVVADGRVCIVRGGEGWVEVVCRVVGAVCGGFVEVALVVVGVEIAPGGGDATVLALPEGVDAEGEEEEGVVAAAVVAIADVAILASTAFSTLSISTESSWKEGRL